MGNETNGKSSLTVWINNYLCGEMNAASFTLLVMLRYFAEKEIPCFLTSNIPLICDYLLRNHLPPKKEQRIDEIMKKIMITANDTEISDAEKANIISGYDDDIQEILELVMNG